MKQIRFIVVLALMAGFSNANAQKTVEGVKFSACLNKKDLPTDFYKGKFLVLDFWATWCGPCIASFPKVDALQKKYKSNSKVIFASITAESPGHIDSFFSRKKDIMPGVLHLADKESATWQYFDINFIPQVLVFNPSGKLVFTGRAESLAESMDKILKGADLMTHEVKEPVDNKWEAYKQSSAFIAITGLADTSRGSNSGTNTSSDKSKVSIEENNSTLIGVIEGAGRLTSQAIKFNDAEKANQLIFLYYKQSKNNFPEFDNGIFSYQYQNHILHLLERVYSFRSEWITERVTAYKIVITDKKLLAAAETLSTRGSYGSRNGKKYTFVNQTLQAIAATSEDGLNMPVIADTGSAGYDIELDFSDVEACKKSLAIYGLEIARVNGCEKKKLNILFY